MSIRPRKAQPVGRVQFDVQDFVPQKLKVTLTAETKVAKANSDISVKVESRFLYGAPAGGLTGEGETRIVTDTDPFADYEGWAVRPHRRHVLRCQHHDERAADRRDRRHALPSRPSASLRIRPCR